MAFDRGSAASRIRLALGGVEPLHYTCRRNITPRVYRAPPILGRQSWETVKVLGYSRRLERRESSDLSKRYAKEQFVDEIHGRQTTRAT